MKMRIVECIVCGMEFQAAGLHYSGKTCSLACRCERIHGRRLRYLQADRKGHLDKERERGRRWYKANREKAREQARLRRSANLERARERDRRYRAANLEQLRAKDRRRNNDDQIKREKRREMARRRYAANREKMREKNRRYYHEVWREQKLEYDRQFNAQVMAALQTFRKLIGPCDRQDRYIARRILQQLTEGQTYDNATS